ncbi:hypothetical protein Tco_1077228 [Tanacetum coccineum]
MEDYCLLTAVVVILFLGFDAWVGFGLKGTKYYVTCIVVLLTLSVVAFLLIVNFLSSRLSLKGNAERGDSSGRVKGDEDELSVCELGERSVLSVLDGKGNVEHESTVLERGNSSGRVKDDEDELSVCELGESRGREGVDDYESSVLDSDPDVSYESSVLDNEWDGRYGSILLEEGESSDHLGRCIYLVICEGGYEGGDNSGCDSRGCYISEGTTGGCFGDHDMTFPQYEWRQALGPHHFQWWCDTGLHAIGEESDVSDNAAPCFDYMRNKAFIDHDSELGWKDDSNEYYNSFATGEGCEGSDGTAYD